MLPVFTHPLITASVSDMYPAIPPKFFCLRVSLPVCTVPVKDDFDIVPELLPTRPPKYDVLAELSVTTAALLQFSTIPPALFIPTSEPVLLAVLVT